MWSGDVNSWHHLKCWPEYFQLVLSGAKTFELRLDDRGFQVGDRITLHEWNPDSQAYTGQSVEMRVTFVLRLRDYRGAPGWRWAIACLFMPDLVVISGEFSVL
jgi:hypothetical protein